MHPIDNLGPNKEYDEFELDAGKALILLLGNVGHEGVLSTLSASKRQYKRKMLDSTPENWASIVEYFKSFRVTGILVKLTPQTFHLLSLGEYEHVRKQLFSHIVSIPNAVFVFEDMLTGKRQDDYRSYPSMDVMESVLAWLGSMKIDLIPYRKNAEVTVLAEKFLEDTEKNLIFRLYIPNGRIWSNEADRFLQLFRDYLGRVVHLPTRLDQRRTDQGIIYEFHGDEPQGESSLQSEFTEFSQFLDLCASNPDAAGALLSKKEINQREILDIIARYSKEAKRLQVDLKHERERKMLTIRQRLESELIDFAPTASDWTAINKLINGVIPYVGESAVMLLNDTVFTQSGSAGKSGVSINLRQQIIQNVNGIVGQEIYGDHFLTQEDQQLLTMIKKYGGNKTRALESAVHELADNSAPQAERLSAKQRIIKFLIEIGKRTADVATGVLQTYIEKKLGI